MAKTWYEIPANAEVFTKSDVVAIVKVISGEVLDIKKGGGIKVNCRVVEKIKNTNKDETLKIFYATGRLQGLYIATLKWDKELHGYKYYSPNEDIELIKFDSVDSEEKQRQSDVELETVKYNKADVIKFMERWGLKGEPILSGDKKYYLPICRVECDDDCQRKFDFVQFMLSKAGNQVQVEERVPRQNMINPD